MFHDVPNGTSATGAFAFASSRVSQRFVIFSTTVFWRRRARRLVKSTLVERLVLVEAGEDERLLAGDRVDVALEALRADLFHHALHRRVDRADADVRRVEVRREDAVPRVLAPRASCRRSRWR